MTDLNPRGHSIEDLRAFLTTTPLFGSELARALAPYTIRLNPLELEEIADRVINFTKAKSNNVVVLTKLSVRSIFSEARAAFQLQTINKNRPAGSDPAKAAYEKFRQVHVVVRTMPGQVIDLRGDGDSPILNMRHRDLEHYVSNTIAEYKITANGKPVPVTYFEKWEKDAERREFERLVIDKPGIAPAGCYNLFLDYAVKPQQGSWDTIKEYLLNTLCRGVVEHYDYLYQWFCFKIQHPGWRTEVLIHIVGGQGTGKTTLFELLKAIFGHEFAMLFDDPNAVDQAFNSQIAFRAITAYDEAFYSKSHKARQKIKGMITSERVTINKKNVPQFRHLNHQGILIFSNAGAGVGLDHDDRRQLVLRSSTEHANDKPYFKKVYDAINGTELQAFLYDALNVELPERLPDPPKTAARRDAIAETASSNEEFVYHLLWEGNSHWFGYPIISQTDQRADFKKKAWNPWPLGAIAVNAEELQKVYREYMAAHHKRKDMMLPRQLTSSIRSLLGDDCFFHTKEGKLTGKTIPSQRPKDWDHRVERWTNIAGATPVYVWYARSLNECRARYEKKIGPVTWDAVYDEYGNRLGDSPDAESDEEASEENVRLMEESQRNQ
jgi:hypothetical protein